MAPTGISSPVLAQICFPSQLHLLPGRNSAWEVLILVWWQVRSGCRNHISRTGILPCGSLFYSLPNPQLPHPLFVERGWIRFCVFSSLISLAIRYLIFSHGILELVMENSPFSALSFFCEDCSFRLFPWINYFGKPCETLVMCLGLWGAGSDKHLTVGVYFLSTFDGADFHGPHSAWGGFRGPLLLMIFYRGLGLQPSSSSSSKSDMLSLWTWSSSLLVGGSIKDPSTELT